MKARLDESPNPKNYLIELTNDLANKILNDRVSNQVQPFVKMNDYHFFFIGG